MQRDLAALVSEYAALAERHGSAIQTGRHRDANSSHDKLREVLGEIAAFGEAGRVAVHDLMRSEGTGDAVKVWAAKDLLGWATEDAIQVLESISQKPGVIAFGASMTLREWRRGRLKAAL